MKKNVIKHVIVSDVYGILMIFSHGYIIEESYLQLYLPKEYEYIKNNHNFPTKKIKKIELLFDSSVSGGKLDLYCTQCNDVFNCNK